MIILIIVLLVAVYFISLLANDTHHSKRSNTLFFTEDLLKEEKINTALNEIVKLTGDRVSLYQLHNGTQYSGSKIHIKFISKVDEEAKPGIARDISNQQQMPTSLFRPFLKDLFKHGSYFCYKTDLLPDSNFRQFLLDKGIKSLYAFLVKSLDGKEPIGILTVAYISGYHEITQEHLRKIVQFAQRLSGYLN